MTRDTPVIGGGLPAAGELAAPPANLTPAPHAERLYVALAPVAREDEQHGWALLIYANALGVMFQLVDDWERDSADGPGWSMLMDLDRCPDEALPWLAQFVGVRIPTGLSADERRAWVAGTDGFKRGTPAAMRAAASATLTGDKTVIFRERSGDPTTQPIDYAYYLDVSTYDSQTPDPAATERALLAQKPGGIVLRYRHTPGQDYLLLNTNHADYAAVRAAYVDYDAVRHDTPV